MCVVNRSLVADIERLIGSQTEIMGRVGISWNSWIKVVGGLPIRLSVGQRLRARILDSADSLPGLQAKFPPSRSGETIDRSAFEQAFLEPVFLHRRPESEERSLRSVRRAMVESQHRIAAF